MISEVQEHLERIYGIRCPADVERFVIDRALAEELGAAGDREQLFVQESEDGLDLALYLEPALIERLRRYPHPRGLLERELDGYCQVAEGVSHFMYLAHAASLERRVSLLELEAQAEVDKFALCLLHRWGDGALHWARELIQRLFDTARLVPALGPELRHRIQRLFDTARLVPALGPELRHRYEESSRLARQYCQRLLALVKAGDLQRLLGELRYSYRLGAEAKLRYLAQSA